MSVESTPYFWLECDTIGCQARSGDDADFSAFADASTAIEQAQYGDWLIVDENGAEAHYCPTHAFLTMDTDVDGDERDVWEVTLADAEYAPLTKFVDPENVL